MAEAHVYGRGYEVSSNCRRGNHREAPSGRCSGKGASVTVPPNILTLLNESRDCTAAELVSALDARQVEAMPNAPGRETAGSLHATFTLRDKTSAAAGVIAAGLKETLRALHDLDGTEQVLLYHFTGREKVFTVFVRDRGEVFVGCVRADRQSTERE